MHFLLAPGVNINRAPMNGRNFEYFGEDPFLASRIAVSYINGVQSQGVSATVKHFLGNNSEFDRHNTDSIIDERTLREIYLPVFEAAVKEAHVGAIMDSYNLTNGLHMSQNKYLLTDVVKKEWGFDGLIMSDWSATYDGVEAANGGQDLEMPSGVYMNRKVLLPAIEQGKVSVATIDDKVRRILSTAVRFGWLDRDQTGLSIPRYNLQGRQVALNAAREGITLLKNEGSLLPLDKSKIKSVLVIGPDAYPAVPVGGGSAEVQPFASVSFLEGLKQLSGRGISGLLRSRRAHLQRLGTLRTSLLLRPMGRQGLQAEYFDNLDLNGQAGSQSAPSSTSTSAPALVCCFRKTPYRHVGPATTRRLRRARTDIFVQTTRESRRQLSALRGRQTRAGQLDHAHGAFRLSHSASSTQSLTRSCWSKPDEVSDGPRD